MNKVHAYVLGAVLLAVLSFQQYQITQTREDVAAIAEYLVKTNERVNYTKKDMECLARNVFYEAGVEDRAGKYAVAQVTLNRLRKGHWGDSICKVVHSKSQFSWTLKRKLPQPKGLLWAESQQVAMDVLKQGVRVQSLREATHYHTDYIKPPGWSRSVVKIQQVGQHIFYKT